MRDGLSNKPSQAAEGHGGAGGRPGSWNCPRVSQLLKCKLKSLRGHGRMLCLGKTLKNKNKNNKNGV